MRNFQDKLETRKRSFISTFSICMTVPLMEKLPFIVQFVAQFSDKCIIYHLAKCNRGDNFF